MVVVLLLQETLQVEPFGEAVDPVIGRQVLVAHAEAMAASCEHVQFHGFVRRSPFLPQLDAVWSEAELIVGGAARNMGGASGGTACLTRAYGQSQI